MKQASVLDVLTCGSVLAFAAMVACGSGRDGFEDTTPGEADAGGGGSEGGALPRSDANEGLPQGETRDPVDCEEAKTSKSYVGCDYWPTVTPNSVWSIFDYAVVVANTGDKDASIDVSGPNSVNKQVTVPAGELRKIYLPWVPALKGGDATECATPPSLSASVGVEGGAYHLVSSVPVIVYQFNALQYKGEGGEGPDGGAKDWSSCPGNGTESCGFGRPHPKCFSYSNDASLLLPSTAMTNNYRVVAHRGNGKGTALTVTATQADTEVTLITSSTAEVTPSTSGSPSIPATNANGKVTIKLAQAGDVAQFVTAPDVTIDFSGSLVQSTKPVQVISSIPCVTIPEYMPACDHIEETVAPAETLGKRYFVAPPTGPEGYAVSHKVRIYGNRDNTKLTYAPTKPPGCPGTINASQVVDCGLVTDAFEVTGDNEFAVATFLLGASVYESNRMGDPSQSVVASVEQFRTKYVFLAPNDYPVLWADVIATEDAAIELDGKPLSAPWTKIGSGPFGILRVDLSQSGKDGAHKLVAKKPVGVQVIGFGASTSFQYPAGLNLNLIAPSPPPPR